MEKTCHFDSTLCTEYACIKCTFRARALCHVRYAIQIEGTLHVHGCTSSIPLSFLTIQSASLYSIRLDHTHVLYNLSRSLSSFPNLPPPAAIQLDRPVPPPKSRRSGSLLRQTDPLPHTSRDFTPRMAHAQQCLLIAKSFEYYCTLTTRLTRDRSHAGVCILQGEFLPVR